MLNLLLFLVLNAVVFSGAWLIVRYGLGICDILGTVLATSLVGWLVIVMGLELLAQFNLLRLGAACGLSVAALLVGLVVRWLRHAPAIEPQCTQSSVVDATISSEPRGNHFTSASTIARVCTAAVAVIT